MPTNEGAELRRHPQVTEVDGEQVQPLAPLLVVRLLQEPVQPVVHEPRRADQRRTGAQQRQRHRVPDFDAAPRQQDHLPAQIARLEALAEVEVTALAAQRVVVAVKLGVCVLACVALLPAVHLQRLAVAFGRLGFRGALVGAGRAGGRGRRRTSGEQPAVAGVVVGRGQQQRVERRLTLLLHLCLADRLEVLLPLLPLPARLLFVHDLLQHVLVLALGLAVAAHHRIQARFREQRVADVQMRVRVQAGHHLRGGLQLFVREPPPLFALVQRQRGDLLGRQPVAAVLDAVIDAHLHPPLLFGVAFGAAGRRGLDLRLVDLR
mmetsp:Transcript_29990/g.92522  ORF Transcript_29990/g.92522 Transcript_29990/m.92522 type:complete len:320 (-) Transcript_29990:63-1022(-)